MSHHEVPMQQFVQSFYFDLDEHNRQMVDAYYGDSFLYKTPEEAWKLFEDLNKNSRLHATFSHSDLPRQLRIKGKFYDVSHSVNLFSIVDALAKKLINCCASIRCLMPLLCKMCVRLMLVSCILLLTVLVLLSLTFWLNK